VTLSEQLQLDAGGAMTSILEQRSQIGVDVLDGLEKKFGISFSDEYKSFLINTNGGKPSPKRFVTLDKKVESMVVRFFSAGTNEEESLEVEYEEYVASGAIPSDFIPIAYDPAGNRVLLCVGGEGRESIYYWSVDEEPEEFSCSRKYMRKISNGFNEFFDGLF
jgi:hypothetical protein